MVICVVRLLPVQTKYLASFHLDSIRCLDCIDAASVWRQKTQSVLQELVFPQSLALTSPPNVHSITPLALFSIESTLSSFMFPVRKQQPRNTHTHTHNQNPVCLDGFISIRLHSRASRFLISHFTIKDKDQGRAGGVIIQQCTWLSNSFPPGEV